MKKFFLLSLITIFSTSATKAQVGINTDTPLATLDIRGTNHLGSVTARDGILIPTVTDLVAIGLTSGQLVFLTQKWGNSDQGFYYWSNEQARWVPLSELATSSNVGGIQLKGDLEGFGSSANAPIISENAITSQKILDHTITVSDIYLNDTAPTKSYLRSDGLWISGNTITDELQLKGTITVSTFIPFDTATTPCNNSNKGSIGFDGTHFWGCNGTTWRQLDN